MVPHPPRPAIAILLTIIIISVGSQSFAQESQPTISELLQKRRDVLAQLVKVETEAYQRGEVDIEAVGQARRELLAAELQLAADHAERIKLLEQSVQLALKFEEIAEARYKAARASVADMLKCRADRLAAQTALLRERQRAEEN